MANQEMTSVLAEPIAVEFPYAGGWYPGVLLGWAHDGVDDCRIRVQCVIGGLRRTTWMTLADLRLPAPAAATRRDGTPRPTAAPSGNVPDAVPSYSAPRPRTGGWTLSPA